MPLIFHKKLEDQQTEVAVWKKTEKDADMHSQLDLSPEQNAFIESMPDHRRQEWLCSRLLVKELIKDQKYKLYKDSFGKPFLINSPYFISLSHSNDMAAVILSKKLVGIDIQFETEQLNRIYHKYISPEELAAIDADHLLASYHLFWSGKEAMYKAYGKRQLDFRSHMHIYPFKYYQHKLELKGWVRKNNTSQDYDIFCDRTEDYYLVYAILESWIHLIELD